MREATDDELLAACLRGEAAGWEALLDRYAALIYSIALKYGLEEADAADVFQSVCVILLEHLASIRAPAGVAAWLITTTRRQCMALLRRRRREQADTADQVALPDPAELPEAEFLALERQRLVRAAVSRLSGNCRRIVEALFSETPRRSSYQQLASDLGVPINSLGPTRARCLERLRRLLISAGYIP